MFRAMMAVVALSVLSFTACAQDKGTAEQKAVRVYLRENLSSGKFEEIKWSGPLVRKDGKTAMRLKFRTANRFGALQVTDDAFLLKGGKVTDWFPGAGPSYVRED